MAACKKKMNEIFAYISMKPFHVHFKKGEIFPFSIIEVIIFLKSLVLNAPLICTVQQVIRD